MIVRRGGLSKNDAPLRIQYEKGHTAFKRGHVASPFKTDTMQYREWLRGFNSAYFKNMEEWSSEKRV